MLGRQIQSARKPTLLSRYSETLGELSLRKQTELALLAAKTESDMANRAKSAFLGTMSHELRTPLNAIIGFSDLIRNMKADKMAVETSIDYASHIAKAGRHLLEIISDILDISKIESGTFQLNIDIFPIGEVIEGCVPLVEERIAAKNQILEVRLDKNLPHIPIDARRVKQIVINILANATKFTPERGRILLTARRNGDGGATIAVVDSGIGMTPDEIAIALKPFEQVQSALSRFYEGTGLGLSIARGLARQHGGNLYIESEPGLGTSVVLTLRATPPHPAAAPPAIVVSGGGERRVPRKGTFIPKGGAS
jgi:two-component system cell cycle sensor histidine kinase PleC